jgi:hypothetical protein
VGAWGDDDNGSTSGSAYVFRRNQSGPDAWGQVAKITPADGAYGDSFGWSVAISDDTAVIGAHLDDDNGSNSGSAYVFRRDQGGPDNWGQIAKITAADGAAYAYFGWSVTISADTAVVGADGDDDNGEDSGSAYVFQREHGGTDAWGQVSKITPVDGAEEDYFGTSVSISGNTAVVGAYGDDYSGTDSGSAYVFQRDQGGPNAWGQLTKIAATDGAAGDEYGYSVSINGDITVVGAPKDDDNNTNSGSAYILQRDQSGPNAWAQTAKITAADGEYGDSFGGSVAISGDIVVVGAYGDDDNGSYTGSAYVFRRDQGGPDAWGQVAKITAAGGAVVDYFGWSVSISGDNAIVGGWGDNDLGEYAGAAYVFTSSDILFVDGFEIGYTSMWSATTG